MREVYQDLEGYENSLVTEKNILELVDKFIKQKHSKKSWKAGKDWVQYAGPYFDSQEYVAAIKTLLGEWLVLGAETIKFIR